MLLGINKHVPDQKIIQMQGYIINSQFENFQWFKFSDPKGFWQQSKVFVFPIEKVFANFSLLESMSYGIVPIISNIEYADRIVKDG